MKTPSTMAETQAALRAVDRAVADVGHVNAYLCPDCSKAFVIEQSVNPVDTVRKESAARDAMKAHVFDTHLGRLDEAGKFSAHVATRTGIQTL